MAGREREELRSMCCGAETVHLGGLKVAADPAQMSAAEKKRELSLGDIYISFT